jgi:hypothetical protein
VTDRLQPAKEARGAKQRDHLEGRLAVVGCRDGSHRPLTALADELGAPSPADPVHDPSRDGLFPIRYLE